jgi:hypothetical protein
MATEPAAPTMDDKPGRFTPVTLRAHPLFYGSNGTGLCTSVRYALTPVAAASYFW